MRASPLGCAVCPPDGDEMERRGPPPPPPGARPRASPPARRGAAPRPPGARRGGEGWAGCGRLPGTPGSTGATPIQNVGGYGQDVGEPIVRVEPLDRTTDRVVWFTNWDCRFAYRSSLFKDYERDRYVVLSV